MSTQSTKFEVDYEIDDNQLLDLVKEIKEPLLIEEIDLQYIQSTDNSLIPLFQACKNVKKVIIGESRITDNGLIALFENCPHVTELDCSNTEITDESLTKLPYHNLTHLDLGYCNSDITNKSISHLATICTNLIHLNISYNEEITSRSLEKLLTKNPNLKELIIDGCTGLSSGITKTIDELKLTTFSYSYCPNLCNDYD